jgi:hypothetical protein
MLQGMGGLGMREMKTMVSGQSNDISVVRMGSKFIIAGFSHYHRTPTGCFHEIIPIFRYCPGKSTILANYTVGSAGCNKINHVEGCCI